MEREAHFDRALWQDRFENDVGYCLSAADGVFPLSDLVVSEGLVEACRLCFLVKTSGSSGEAKWVLHSKESLLEHAVLVNTRLGITGEDVLGLTLPTYHVGGLGVIARGLVSGARVVEANGKWSASGYLEFLVKNEVSITSLVPTQVVDIVAAGLLCPDSVRVVVVGGGSLDSCVRDEASDLGWPLSESYGMTETGSQIANGGFIESGYLNLIDGWQVRLSVDGLLEVKGDCLLKGYLVGSVGEWKMVDPKVGGWFTTSDRVDLLERDGRVGLKFLGRSDQQVKILGELVDVSALERRLREEVKDEIYLVVLPDERRGVKLFPVVMNVSAVDCVRDLEWGGLHRLEDTVVVSEFPYNVMGKLSRSKLVEVVESVVFSSD